MQRYLYYSNVRLLILVLHGCLAATFCRSQVRMRDYEWLPLEKRASFGKIPANWVFADSVAIHPEKPNPVKIIPGSRILVGKPGEAIVPSLYGGNFKLYLVYSLSPGASATVSLPGGGFIVISEGRAPEPEKISGFTGLAPSQDAGKAAGLSQTLEIDYESNIPGLPGKARINEVRINGVVVRQGQYTDSRLSSPAISILVDNGTAVFAAIGFQKFENRRPVLLSGLTYKIYNDDWDSRTTDKLALSGNSPELTFEVAEDRKNYNLVYEGDLVVKENGDYNFTTLYTGAYCQLSIDGNVVLDTDHSTSQEAHRTNVRIEAGTHKIRLWYSKLPWERAALGLRVGKTGVRDYDLHALSSLPEPPVKPFLSAEPGAQRPEMIRSFIRFPGETHKRTHCLSVGAPSQRSFSVDLNRAALLQVWSGEFANTTEMWYERGEPQLLTPLGQTETISGRSSFARLTGADAPWVDSASVGFMGYRMDPRGYPVIRYALGPSIIEDAITTTGKSINRTVTPERNASSGNYVLLAEGRQIVSVEKGLYIVDGRYYIKVGGQATPTLRRSRGKAELLLQLAQPVSYSIIW